MMQEKLIEELKLMKVINIAIKTRKKAQNTFKFSNIWHINCFIPSMTSQQFFFSIWMKRNSLVIALIVTLFSGALYGFPTLKDIERLSNLSAFDASTIVANQQNKNPTLDEYIADIILHRSRVKYLLIRFAVDQGWGFKTVELYEKYALLHDLPKIMELEDLREYGYTHELTIAERLLEFHGIRKEDMPKEQRERYNFVSKDLDMVENGLKKLFFNGELFFRELTKFEINELKSVEFLMDVIDTYLSRMRELGGKGYTPVDWFAKRGKFLFANLAKKYIEVHESLTGDVWNNQRLKVNSCRRFFFFK